MKRFRTSKAHSLLTNGGSRVILRKFRVAHCNYSDAPIQEDRGKEMAKVNKTAIPHDSGSASLDPITLDVIRHGIISICDQIDANMTRTAFRPYIYAYKDYAVGFVTAEGEFLTQ